MKKAVSIFVFLLIFINLKFAEACKCRGQYKDAEDMYNQADIVFYGQQILPESDLANSKKDIFEIYRLVKSKIPLGTGKLTTNKSADWNAMCGGHYQNHQPYLVFIKINPVDKSLQTMDECYSDVISSDSRKYHFRNQDFGEFSFFKVNPVSAGNGEMPLYADTLEETRVREFALQTEREWRRKNAPAGALVKTCEITDISRKNDEYGQPYWNIRIEATEEDRAKGDFRIVHVYNTFSDGIFIYPGK